MNQRRGIQRRIDDAGYAFSDAIREYEKTEKEIQQKQELLESNRSYREALLKNHKEVHSMQVNADSLCCPMCKQTLPPDQREAKLEEFQSNKQKSLDDIVKNGKQTAANIETLEKEISNNGRDGCQR